MFNSDVYYLYLRSNKAKCSEPFLCLQLCSCQNDKLAVIFMSSLKSLHKLERFRFSLCLNKRKHICKFKLSKTNSMY